MNSNLYFDYNATAPLKKEVVELMCNLLPQTGNASAVHKYGRDARKVIEDAREQVAELAGTHPNQVTFTSGATEANNAIINAFKDEKILVSAIEHPSVLSAAQNAEKIPVTKDGVIDLDILKEMLESGPSPKLISVMLVNNETGAIQPVKEISTMAKKIHPDIHIHTDAVQAAGRIKIDMPSLGVDYLTLSAHKMGGPQGVGALLIAPGARAARLIVGGGQEKRQRAGTENTAGIAGFGLACELAIRDLVKFQSLETLREKLENGLKEVAPELVLYSTNVNRVANTLAMSLPGIATKTQVMSLDLDGIAISGGSACSSGKEGSSHVAQAMDVPKEQIIGASRVSIGWDTKETDIDEFIKAWSKMYQRVKNKVIQTEEKE
jgi:cysteine desulfurase